MYEETYIMFQLVEGFNYKTILNVCFNNENELGVYILAHFSLLKRLKSL